MPVSTFASGALDLIRKATRAPALVVFESFMAAFMAGAILVYGSVSESMRPDAGAIAAPLIAIAFLALMALWAHDEDGWEALCHPWRRADRIYQEEKREREEREALEASEAAAAKKTKIENYYRMKALYGDDWKARRE